MLICENMLMAQGFTEAKVLASKFYCLYNLLKDLLSKQEHYDWGLRAIKSVLVVAGDLLRLSPNENEDSILMRALRDFNIAKIVKSDEVVFFGLLGDLFPGLDPPRQVDQNVADSVEEAVNLVGLWADPEFCLKCVQLDELLAIRHCVFVMGPPGAFKSECWKMLAHAWSMPKCVDTTCGPVTRTKVKLVDVNPKVLPTQDLYGYINMATREWKDGLLSNIMRDLGQIPDEKPKWILLDGDLDANWIESMNSVMDDNRLLTLASNERIPLKPFMRMIFEIRDLKHATPATVSRAGIIYISTDDGFQWRAMVATWVRAQPAELFTDEKKALLTDYFEAYCAPTLRFLKMDCISIVPQQETSMVNSLLRLLDATLDKVMLEDERTIETAFSWCAVWAFGSALGLGDDGTDYKKVFSDWWKRQFRKIAFGNGTVFDFWLNPEGVVFDSWKESPSFKEIEFNSMEQSMSEVTVPTGETSSVSFWMDKLVKAGHAVMLAGLSGTGKTQLVKGQLGSLNPEEMMFTTINMNFYTSGVVLLSIMELPLQKKTGSLFGPPGAARMLYFVDDLNLPEVDKYMTQSAIALIRQHIDYGHWYDPSKLTLKTVEKCQYIASMNPTAGSFLINPRLQRHMTTFAIAMPNASSLMTIYCTFLNGHFKPMAEDIGAMTDKLVKATLAVHKEVSESFRKTAANFHYEFNIRHLAGVFQGILMSSVQRFKDTDKVAFLWLHECQRIYADRLVSPEDLGKFNVLMQANAKKSFPEFNTGKFFSENPEEPAVPLLYAHFMDGLGEDPVYDLVPDINSLRIALESGLEDYNETNAQMDLVLFEDAMRHVCRITRVINNKSGHCMLVGVGGSGKQSLSRLSGHICGFTTMMITISATYSVNDLKADLQSMYMKAGVKQEGVLFLFTDNQITDERFLVYLNDLLGSADIADLYAADEKDTVCNAVAKKAKEAGVVQEMPALYQYFLQQVRANLHVVLCFSPVGDAFRNRCLKFPALINCTVVDWFQPWPKEALFSVGKKFLNEIDLPDEIREQMELFMPHSFNTVNEMSKVYKAFDGRFVYSTPKTYLELLKLYGQMLQQKRDGNDKASARLVNGVAKLENCASTVDTLKEEIGVMLADAQGKREVSEGIAKRVSAEKEIVEMESENAAVEEKKVINIQIEVSEKQASAESDLAKAIPAVEAAMAALDTVNEKDLGMCKTMGTPPPGVGDVFGAVMVLFAGVKGSALAGAITVQKNGKVRDKDRDWNASKKALLGNTKGCLEELKAYKETFDSGCVPEINWKEVRPYLKLDHFTPEIIGGKNAAAGGLCNWVVNITIYYDVVSMVGPKKQLVAEATQQLIEANTKLGEVKAKVAELEARLATLVAELDAANKVKAEAEATVAKGESKLDLANRLINALASENVRWKQSIIDLVHERDLLIGDVLVAASFISYVGPFTKEYRDKLLEDEWLPFMRKPNSQGILLPLSDNPDPLKILSSNAEIAKWNSAKLPSDPVSSENGCVVMRSARWPLMIDPQLQGIAWIKNFESKDEDRPLQISRLGNKDLMEKLKRSLENGLPFLIENMGEAIDAALMPAVSRASIKRGSRFYIKLGDDEVEFHDNFKLYLHTKLGNPHYAPEIQAECSLVNFTVTPRGLEDQLLSLVVQKERPDLAAQKAQLVQQQNQFKIQMIELEDGILAKLSAAEGDITEDRDLILGLEDAKRVATDIGVQMAAGVKTAEVINNTSEKYRAVARRGSQLFFIMNELIKIHTYYIYSLNAFVVVFQSGIEVVQQEEQKAARKNTKGWGLSKFKKISQKVISGLQRFPWNHDILMDASHCAETDVDHKLLGVLFGTNKQSPRAEDVLKKGDIVDSDYLMGEILAVLPAEGDKPSRYVIKVKGLTVRGEATPYVVLKASQCTKYTDYTARCAKLSSSITSIVFNYIRRGLFDRDKLTISTLVVLKLLEHDELLDSSVYSIMLTNRNFADAPEMPEPVKEWSMPEAIWPKLLALEHDLQDKYPDVFAGLTAGMESEELCGQWNEWYNNANPEILPLPHCSTATTFQKCLIMRAMRPDRTTMVLQQYITEMYGSEYVFQTPFDMKATYQESTASTPMFFVLFPGVDPTPWVENLGKTFNITAERDMFVNISMGQGQEAPAEAKLETMSQKGGWVMLQNCHLMQDWLPKLERKLEICSEHASADFRCYISAEPPPLSYMKNMPESLMQSCIKVSNEAPSDIKSNIQRAWAAFDQQRLDRCSMPTEFRGGLFAICFFHAAMLGRKRFGQQGWSRKYGFNMGDLTICADVLEAYLDENGGTVPWDDLRYIFGEIMYGGHITDFWDRTVDCTYLEVIFTPGLLKCEEYGGLGLKAPDCKSIDTYDGYLQFLETDLPAESPPIYGLHQNSEISFLVTSTESVMSTILRLRAGSSGGGGGGGGGNPLLDMIADIIERVPESFDMITMNEKAAPLLTGPSAPYVVVVLQECGRMNILLTAIAKTLDELTKGLNGQLNMSAPMEDLAEALSLNQVPGRNPFHQASWEKLAWPSMKGLQGWYDNVIMRCDALRVWQETLKTPFSLWMPGLFNPTAFLTAIKQVTARAKSKPLDNMGVETHMTTMLTAEEATQFPLDGALVHGLFIEGARWGETDDPQHQQDVEGTACAGILADSKPKELLPQMPLIYIKAVMVQSNWEPSPVGYLRPEPELYNCPVYLNTFRGPTFVFPATLKTIHAPSKWVLAGVAIMMEQDE